MRISRCLSVAALVAAAAPLLAADPPKPLRALLVTGGCCHDYTAQKSIIADGVGERARIEFTVVQQGGSGTSARIPLYENPDWAKGYDVVIHNECFADDKDPAWTARILKPHAEGVPGVVIHCAMHCYRDGTDQWFKFCGVTSRRHGKAYPHEVLNRDADHPIMKSFGAAWANPAGELYWIEKVWPTAHTLASSKNQENGHDETCVWTNQFEKGRVFGTTIGHHNVTMESPEFLDMLTRGTLWACDKLSADYLKPVEPKKVRVNVARGKPATASSEEVGKGNLAARANDGDLATRWCANGPNVPQWWQVDLGKPVGVTGVKLDWEDSGAAYRCKLEGSTDGKTWGRLADFATNTQAGPRDLEIPKGPPSRYIRVTVVGLGGGWASLREVQVFGDETVAVNEAEIRKQASAVPSEVKIPRGYSALVVATPPAVNYPVAVAAAPNGDLYVSSDKNGSLGRGPHRGSVIRLRDVDGDGRADESARFVPDVDTPRGLVWDHDRLYLLHPPHLSAFIDADHDGVAEKEEILVKNLAFTFKDRPGDHTSNGVTLGIDGWLYLAIGDFGFLEATGRDGKKVSLRGGGVVRVRPDGSNLEVYSRGTRNILEVSVDPRLDAFARDNTNDGGGWDIRLHHFSGMEQHGYPSLFKNFPEEILAPLADYGGGSGCGGLYLSEPGFPGNDGDALYTADWGREQVFQHHLTPNGATFAADQSEFLTLPRVTDLDVDASSHLYAASWKGAVFDYAGEDVGYIVRLTPDGFSPEPLPDFATTAVEGLVAGLDSPSARRRMEFQREILRRGSISAVFAKLQAFAHDSTRRLDGRIAAIFAIKQMGGVKASATLASLSGDPTIRAFVLRALTDRRDEMADVPSDVVAHAATDPDPRVRLAATIGLARLGRIEYADALARRLDDADSTVAHTAFRALADLNGVDAGFAVLDDSTVPLARKVGATRALAMIHEAKVVDGLIARMAASKDASTRQAIFAALCRLHTREGVWKGDGWGTRPDTSGPYYQPEAWSESPKIAEALRGELNRSGGLDPAVLLRELIRNKVRLEGSLDVLLDRATSDPKLVPEAVALIARDPAPPPRAMPLLIGAVSSRATPVATWSLAMRALMKSNDPQAWRAVLNSIPRLSSYETKSDLDAAKTAFLNAPHLADQHEILAEVAAGEHSLSASWADAGLLMLTTEKRGTPESREAARRALDGGWSTPRRRVQIIRAVGMIEFYPYEARVLAAQNDPDRSIAFEAEMTAKVMKFQASHAKTGPLIAKLKLPDVITQATRQTGSRATGELLFARQNCVKCHSVRSDEPPRGPALATIAATYKRTELAEAILQPSKTIAQGFATNVIATDDGQTVTGFVVQEAANAVTLRNADGTEITIPTARIEQRGKSDTSVMPEGIVNDLTVSEFASLLDYIQSLSKP